MKPIWDDHTIRKQKDLIDTILQIYESDPSGWEDLTMSEVVGLLMKKSKGHPNPHRVRDFVAKVENERW